MPTNENTEEKLFSQLLTINDEINQQIPLAANRFEEFEAPLIEEQEQDVNIQFHMHEALALLMCINYTASEELEEAYKQFFNDYQLQIDEELNEKQIKELESFLLAKTNEIYLKLEQRWRLLKKFNFISVENIKSKAALIMKDLIPRLCAQGISVLVPDEAKLIAAYMDELRQQMGDLVNKLEHTLPLTENELSLINLYRRQGVEHETLTDELYAVLCFLRQFPQDKKNLNKKAISCFSQDVAYNIEQLSGKLKERKHEYKERDDYTKKLIQIRDTIRSNLFITDVEQFLKSTQSTKDAFKKLETDENKTAKDILKLYFLQTGLYLHLHQLDSGFCDEFTCLSLVKLAENDLLFHHRTEKIMIAYEDEDGHTFLVIDRAKGSVLHDMNTWGERAIIFDPWNKLVCYAKDLASERRRYVSYPEGARWSSIKYSRRDYLSYQQLKDMFLQFETAQNLDAEARETRLREEYSLNAIEPSSLLLHYLQEAVKRLKPSDFKLPIHFYLTSMGNELIKFIPGFQEPVVAIHYELLALLSEKKMSLTAFEFGIAAIIFQLKMYTSFLSPISIAPEAQQRIDLYAMEKVQSTEASIDYLRRVADFKKKNPNQLFTVDQFEKKFGGFKLQEATRLSPLERIKVLQASIAGDVVPAGTMDILYPSQSFARFLQSISRERVVPPALIQIGKVQALGDEMQDITAELAVINDAGSQMSQSEEATKDNYCAADSELVSAPIEVFTLQEKVWTRENFSQERMHILKQLIAQLPELRIELLPYEEFEAPSIRLREFCDIARNLDIDYDNPQESDLVDQLINQANDLKIPGFDNIYYAFAGLWRNHRITLEVNLKAVLVTPEVLEPNYYYLIRNNNHWYLSYIDLQRYHYPISVSDVPGLEEELPLLVFEKDGVEYINYDVECRIEYWLKEYQGLRPLGFFKDIQQALTCFTQSQFYEEARDNAERLRSLMLDYDEHMCDKALYHRRSKFNQKKKKSQEALTGKVERFYGSILGRYVRWQGFDTSEKSQFHENVILRFIDWAARDKSGTIALLLYKLGFSNHQEVLMAMTEKDLNRASAPWRTDSYTFFALFKGPLKCYSRFSQFSRLKLWVAEKKSQSHVLRSEALQDPSLTFEQAFCAYFDNNFPALLCPHLGFNAATEAQKQLLAAFYQVAQQGSEEDKKVVKSFFYGREDKRDLQRLLFAYREYGRLALSSAYSQFLFFQKFGENTHNLFDDYNFQAIAKADLFSVRHSDVLTLEQWRLVFRAPPASSRDALFRTLLLIDKEKKLTCETQLINSYLHEAGQIHMFSESALLIVQKMFTVPFLPKQITAALNSARWPKFDEEVLETIPVEVLIENYILLDRWTLFPSRQIREDFGRLILQRIQLLGVERQGELLEKLLFRSFTGKLPISDISLKNKVIDQLVILYAAQWGIDDGSTAFAKKIMPFITRLQENLFDRDIKQFMSKFLAVLEAQAELSETVGLYVDPGDYKLFTSSRYKATRNALATLIKVADFFNKQEENQKALLEYLSSIFNQNNLSNMLEHVKRKVDVKKLSEIMGWNFLNYNDQRTDDEKQTDEKLSTLLMTLHYLFWDFSLHERAAVIEQLLISSSKTITAKVQLAAYDKGFDYIAAKLFPKAKEQDSDDYLAFCIMKSYLQTADNYSRSYLLAAMLVSATEHSDQEVSIGKKLAIVCEHMGPAYIKLAQAIHSHPRTPAALRADLAHIKGRANPPHRWSLWRHLKGILPSEELHKIKRLGQLLGSASYNLGVEVEFNDGSKAVLLLLRENARLTAKKGFNHIRSTILDCAHDAITSQRDTIIQTIDEAARLSEDEMDKDASDKQSGLAERLYPKMMKFNVNHRPVEVNVNTARIISSGYGYRFVEKMDGEEFNCLPDDTDEDKFIKKAVAKAVMLMELHNILRGGPFDSDRHGNQLRVRVTRQVVDGQTALKITLGLYDFGEMALEPPDKESLRQLVQVFQRVSLKKLSDPSALDTLMAEQITRAGQKGQSTHFLMRLRKAFLAMQDFQHYLDQDDMISILKILASKKDLHPLVSSEVTQLARKAQLITGVQGITTQVSRFATRYHVFGAAERQPRASRSETSAKPAP